MTGEKKYQMEATLSEYSSEFLSHIGENDLCLLNKERVPHHVAIIMDGNRRWAKKNSESVNFVNLVGGHWEGAKVLTEIIRAAKELGVKVLTVFGFSTENWSRSPREIQTIFWIFRTFLDDQRKKMIQEGVRFSVIGDLSTLPNTLQMAIKKTQDETKNGEAIDVVVAINYGGRDEIKRTVEAIAADLADNLISKEEISEELISKYLDTKRWPDPDLLIRTSGELRLSNFLLWQLAYTEVYVTEVLWPDFTPRHFLSALLEYQNRKRRKGI